LFYAGLLLLKPPPHQYYKYQGNANDDDNCSLKWGDPHKDVNYIIAAPVMQKATRQMRDFGGDKNVTSI
jgi:hypothetical protein